MYQFDSDDTIFALASGAVKSAVSVIRISGIKAQSALLKFVGFVPQPKLLKLVSLVIDSYPIDQALVVFFPGPKSFTGQDCAEFHVHGSRAVVHALLNALGTLEGFRLANPGEFVQRAFQFGKMDLSQIEGLADLIDSDTKLQSRQALTQLKRTLSQHVEEWRDELLTASGIVEAAMDFPDEDEISEAYYLQCQNIIQSIVTQLTQALLYSKSAERLREGFSVVLIGEPNVGKSSLLNAIAKREVAIVSEFAGTTRDIVEISLDLDGVPVRLIDTAGIRESNNPVEKIGIRRTCEEASSADILLVLCELGQAASLQNFEYGQQDIIRVSTKADLVRNRTINNDAMIVSALSGEGVDVLLNSIRERLIRKTPPDGTFIVRERHKKACLEASELLQEALRCQIPQEAEILAEDLRLARHALEKIIGKIGTEDILTEIFSRFCLGK